MSAGLLIVRLVLGLGLAARNLVGRRASPEAQIGRGKAIEAS